MHRIAALAAKWGEMARRRTKWLNQFEPLTAHQSAGKKAPLHGVANMRLGAPHDAPQWC